MFFHQHPECSESGKHRYNSQLCLSKAQPSKGANNHHCLLSIGYSQTAEKSEIPGCPWRSPAAPMCKEFFFFLRNFVNKRTDTPNYFISFLLILLQSTIHLLILSIIHQCFIYEVIHFYFNHYNSITIYQSFFFFAFFLLHPYKLLWQYLDSCPVFSIGLVSTLYCACVPVSPIHIIFIQGETIWLR